MREKPGHYFKFVVLIDKYLRVPGSGVPIFKVVHVRCFVKLNNFVPCPDFIKRFD